MTRIFLVAQPVYRQGGRSAVVHLTGGQAYRDSAHHCDVVSFLVFLKHYALELVG